LISFQTVGDATSSERFTIEDDGSADSGVGFEDVEQLEGRSTASSSSVSVSDSFAVQVIRRRRPAHFVRAIVESIAFRSFRILKTMDAETSYSIGRIK
jgi:hypothetical protein